MKGKFKFIFLPILFISAIALITIFIKRHDLLLFDPKGVIADAQKGIIFYSMGLMLAVAIPTVLLIYYFAWKYRVKEGEKIDWKENESEKDPKHEFLKELGLWAIPTIVIVILMPVLWHGAHNLDPYKPIAAAEVPSGAAPITIQVIAMEWKWVFIYPEQHIATVNLMEFPAGTPVNLEITGIDVPMSSFWIPQLAGQIYAMSGMETQLHIMADAPGEFEGKNTEINGAGYAGMSFRAKAVPQSEFAEWVANTEDSAQPLTQNAWNTLKEPSSEMPTSSYSMVSSDLFDKILMKYMAGDTSDGNADESSSSVNPTATYN